MKLMTISDSVVTQSLFCILSGTNSLRSFKTFEISKINYNLCYTCTSYPRIPLDEDISILAASAISRGSYDFSCFIRLAYSILNLTVFG